MQQVKDKIHTPLSKRISLLWSKQNNSRKLKEQVFLGNFCFTKNLVINVRNDLLIHMYTVNC